MTVGELREVVLTPVRDKNLSHEPSGGDEPLIPRTAHHVRESVYKSEE